MTDIIRVPLKEWDWGQATGYYDVQTDTIYILEGSSQEDLSILHEKVHAERRNKLSFKLACVVADTYFIFFAYFCLLGGIFAVIGGFYLIFLCGPILLAVLLILHKREEVIADREAKRRLKAK